MEHGLSKFCRKLIQTFKNHFFGFLNPFGDNWTDQLLDMKNRIFDKSLISHIFITTKDFTLGESSGMFLMIKDANCWKKQHMLLKTTLVDEKTTHIAQNP